MKNDVSDQHRYAERMRRLIVPATLTAVLLLAGCSASAEPEPTPTGETTSTVTMDTPSPTPTIDSGALEQGYVETVRQEVGGELGTITDADLLALGDSVCLSLKDDVPLPSIESSLTDAGFSQAVAVNVITGAGVLLCSDQGAKVIGGW